MYLGNEKISVYRAYYTVRLLVNSILEVVTYTFCRILLLSNKIYYIGPLKIKIKMERFYKSYN